MKHNCFFVFFNVFAILFSLAQCLCILDLFPCAYVMLIRALSASYHILIRTIAFVPPFRKSFLSIQPSGIIICLLITWRFKLYFFIFVCCLVSFRSGANQLMVYLFKLFLLLTHQSQLVSSESWMGEEEADIVENCDVGGLISVVADMDRRLK